MSTNQSGGRSRIVTEVAQEVYNLRGETEVTVKTRRRPVPLSQVKMAKLADLPENTYYRVENGEVVPNVEHLAKICKAHGITLRQFFERLEGRAPDVLDEPVPPRPAPASGKVTKQVTRKRPRKDAREGASTHPKMRIVPEDTGE